METENEKQMKNMDNIDIENIFYVVSKLLQVSNIKYSRENTIFLMNELSDQYGSTGIGTLATAIINSNINLGIT